MATRTVSTAAAKAYNRNLVTKNGKSRKMRTVVLDDMVLCVRRAIFSFLNRDYKITMEVCQENVSQTMSWHCVGSCSCYKKNTDCESCCW